MTTDNSKNFKLKMPNLVLALEFDYCKTVRNY